MWSEVMLADITYQLDLIIQDFSGCVLYPLCLLIFKHGADKAYALLMSY